MQKLCGILLALILAACSPAENALPTVQCGETLIVWDVDQAAVTQYYLETIEGDVRATLLSNDIRYRDLNAEDGVLRVHILNPENRPSAATLLEVLPSQIDRHGNMDISLRWEDDGWAEYSMTEEYLSLQVARATTGKIELIRSRLRELGVELPIIERMAGNQFFMITPNGPPLGCGIFRHHYPTSGLEFRMLDGSISIEEALEGHIPVGAEILSSIDRNFALVRERPILTGDQILDVEVTHTFFLRKPIVNIQLDHRGNQILERLSDSSGREPMAIVLDGQIIWQLPVPTHIDNRRLQLRGFSSEEEAQDLVQLLNSPWPLVPLNVVSETVAPDCESGSEDQSSP